MKGGCTRKKSACPKSRPCRPKRRNSCKEHRVSPGPLTNNPYLNFLRYFRKRNNNPDQKAQVSEAAKAWKCLSQNKRCRFVRQANIVRNAERRNRMKGFRHPKKC